MLPSRGVMSSAVAQSSRKRRGDGAQECAPATRRRRLLGPSNFAAVRSFGLRTAMANSPRSPRKHRQGGSARRRKCLLGPSQFSPVRSFGLRVALATGPRRRCRKRRLVDVRHAVLTPLFRRRYSGLLPRARYFPALRPFALRFLLATGVSASRRCRKPALLDMGNCISQLLGKNTSDDGLEVQRERVQVARTESELEAEKGDVMRRGLGDWGVPAFDLSELFKPLTDKDEIEVSAVLQDSSHSDKIIVTHEPSNIEVTKEKLQCLRPRGWLNDEVINLYIELLKERAEREPRRFLKCHFFNTFFYKKLTCGIAGYDYQSVKRWTTLKKLGYKLIECEKIFVPVHREVHWCLAVINMKGKTFQYLDSLGGMGHDVLRVLARYIMDEFKDKSNIEIDISSWVEVSDSFPLQQNGWDCGMFMLKFIDFHSRGLKPFFSQEHMDYFRKRTAMEIMRLRAD